MTNQLLTISVKLKTETDDKIIKAGIYGYVNNREILPKVLLSLEVLRKDKRSRVLIAEAEGFLKKSDQL